MSNCGAKEIHHLRAFVQRFCPIKEDTGALVDD